MIIIEQGKLEFNYAGECKLCGTKAEAASIELRSIDEVNGVGKCPVCGDIRMLFYKK